MNHPIISLRRPRVRASGLLLALAGLLALVALEGVGPAQAAEQKIRSRWMLEFEAGALRTVTVRDAKGGSATHHYVTLEVTNKTEFPRPWHPLVKAVTDTDRTYIAAADNNVLTAIRRAERKPDLKAVGITAGKIKPGETLKTVAIFGQLDTLYDRVNVQIFGLVDPITIYKVEQYGEKSTDENVVLGRESYVVDSAYYDHNQELMRRIKGAAKESGGQVPRPAVEYQQVAESRYWSMDFERLGDEFRAEDDIIRPIGAGWKVKGRPGDKGGPEGLRVISTEG